MPENLSPEAQGLGEPPPRKMPVWAWVLIGCGGAAFLFVMISIIAAIAIPSLLAARSASRVSSETAAVGSCRAYAGSQTIYHRNDWDHDGRLSYAHPFTLMSTCVDGTAGGSIRLLDEAFAAASSPKTPKHGYWFKDMETLGGRPIDWSNDFALCAMPAKYGGARRRTFLVSTAGTVWGKDLGKSGFVADFPADPAAAGWKPAD